MATPEAVPVRGLRSALQQEAHLIRNEEKRVEGARASECRRVHRNREARRGGSTAARKYHVRSLIARPSTGATPSIPEARARSVVCRASVEGMGELSAGVEDRGVAQPWLLPLLRLLRRGSVGLLVGLARPALFGPVLLFGGVGRERSGIRRLRDALEGFAGVLGRQVARQVRLRDDARARLVAVGHQDAPELVGAHRLASVLHVVGGSDGDGRLSHECRAR